MADAIKERPDIGVEDPAHIPEVDPIRQGVQRIVLRTPRSESIGEAKKVRLIDGV
jgi:hypothetical protein